MTREEIDAKLEAVEARNEARFVQVNATMERVADSVARLTLDVQRVGDQSRADGLFTRWTLFGIAVAIVGAFIAIIAFGGDQFGAGKDLGGSLASLDAKMDRIETAQAEAARLDAARAEAAKVTRAAP